MQTVSVEYKENMRKRLRNRGYVQITIGIINKDAQKNVQTDTDTVYFADDPNGIFNGKTVKQQYATCEQDFTKVDGSFYFPPEVNQSKYFSGIVTEDLNGSITFNFGEMTDLDIKGLMIDFSDCYPTQFSITNDEQTRYYSNDSRIFTTEDTFNGTSFITVTPIEMLGGQDRLRIYQFTLGMTVKFTNTEVISFNQKEYVSPISETIPSNDTTFTVDNQDLTYCPDDPDSAIAYMEVGQKVLVQFGYDVDDEGTIEWLDPVPTYLKTWKADEFSATFTSMDMFAMLQETYYRGNRVFYRYFAQIRVYKVILDICVTKYING